MNANGDERIDHDEFVKFFLKVLMGSLEQKMLIAFKCYDMDGDEQIDFKEIKIVLRNIPLQIESRYGNSFMKDNSRVEYLRKKDEDNMHIDTLIDALENFQAAKFYDGGIYFDEFVQLAKEVTSELFLCIFNCIYEYVPCVKNFFLMKAKYKEFL
jgi:Ca2+-binding EF-hand superfamily protein